MQYKKSFLALTLVALMGTQAVFALMPVQTSVYFNGPTISSTTSTTAEVTLSPAILSDLTPEEKARVYFEYGETHQVCIMIYPTPAYCLPKKTEVGKTSATLTNLKPNTSYTIQYKMNNTIYCITTPCPGNAFESLSTQFTTKGSATTPTPSDQITRNLGIGSYGSQVTLLQNILIKRGYLKVQPSGYFGVLTFRAVVQFQRANNIPATGFVGALTRSALNRDVVTLPFVTEETFEGTITAYSPGCFVDGECSISVDGKKIVTTIGWSQAIVGQVRGVPDFASVEQRIGSHAKVYAQKTSNGYTLYGNANYYVEIQ